MNIDEFRQQVAADKEARESDPFWGEKPACTGCGTPIQPIFTGSNTLADGSQMCDDCYFEELGNEIDRHPVGALRVRHFKNED